jgi:hypothetical protein
MSEKAETIRRLRLGDLKRVYRSRYGHTLPDDDAGRADLYELLLVISLGDGHQRKMKNAIEIWAPWMGADEARQLVDNINRTPDHLRRVSAGKMGEKLNLQNWERERLGVRTIAPVDMTPEQLKVQRKAKDRDRKWRERRAAQKKPREAWLANCLSRTKPWERQGIKRRQWERNRAAKRAAEMAQVHDAGVSAIKLTTSAEQLASCVESQGRGKPRKRVAAVDMQMVRKAARG